MGQFKQSPESNHLRAIASTTHGLRYHPLYGIWKAMIQRCRHKTCKAYPSYGGRGIKVCWRWLDVRSFIRDMDNRPTHKHTLERINNNGPYSPENCAWVTRKHQMCNRRNNVNLTYGGKTMVLSEWAELLNVPRVTLLYRLRRGWSAERTLTEPIQTKMRNRNSKSRPHS